MSARQEPRPFSLASSRIVLIDSSRARSMKAHVLTMTHSASSGAGASRNPASVSIPSMSSESTWFFGQPSVVRWTCMAGGSIPCKRAGLDAAVVRELEGDAEVFLAQHRDDLLQIVAVLARHADLVLLNGGLHPDLRILDEPDDLAGALDRDRLLERDLLPEHAAAALLGIAVGERLLWLHALEQARVEDLD